MLEAGHCACCHKSLALWPTPWSISRKSGSSSGRGMRPQCVSQFGMLAGPTNLRATTGQLPEPVASACWRLIGLLEYHSSNATSRQLPGENILQPPRLLEGARSHREAGVCSQGDWTAGQGLAQKAGYLAIYLSAPWRVPWPKFDVAVPNKVHQADLLFLPHDCVGRKTFHYALTSLM